MKTAAEIVAEKFVELIEMVGDKHERISNFSRTESMIWFILTIRCEIDMEGFESVFEQALSRSELELSIGYMKELGLSEIAQLFEYSISLLEIYHFYGEGNRALIGCHKLPQDVQKEIHAIGRKISKSGALWAVDEQFCELLNSGS